MPPVTQFAVPDPYEYLEGFGQYHSSESVPGSIPLVNNSPQKPALGLRTERISGSSFTAPREQNLQTWLYRARSSLQHGESVPLEIETGFGAWSGGAHVNPNSYHWATFPVPERGAHWVNGQQRVGRNGAPRRKEGLSLWIFSVTEDMPARTVFASLDGETLIVPQAGALDIRTELGPLLVRQNEIAVIPRGVKYRVTLPGDKNQPCRGYICELHQGHFQLPNLGIVGSTGLANVRDFQVPRASFDGAATPDGTAVAQQAGSNTTTTTPKGEGAEKEGAGDWTVISRLDGRPWHCTQDHTPFDVAGWHGTCYPYKYDLARFCVLGNALFDEHDPCLYTVLTAPNHAASPGSAVVDFGVIPPRWNVAEDTLWLPYYHRNSFQEFFSVVVNDQRPEYPFGAAATGAAFAPLGAGLHGAMSTHGAADPDYAAAQARDTRRPAKLQADGLTIFLLETDKPLEISDWALEHAELNPQSSQGAKGRVAKM